MTTSFVQSDDKMTYRVDWNWDGIHCYVVVGELKPNKESSTILPTERTLTRRWKYVDYDKAFFRQYVIPYETTVGEAAALIGKLMAEQNPAIIKHPIVSQFL